MRDWDWKHCQRHYGPRRWLLWPVIFVWSVWFSMHGRLSLIWLGRFNLVGLQILPTLHILHIPWTVPFLYILPILHSLHILHILPILHILHILHILPILHILHIHNILHIHHILLNQIPIVISFPKTYSIIGQWVVLVFVFVFVFVLVFVRVFS